MKNKKLSGQTLAEFALVLPMLLLLVMGVFDLGRGIYFYSAITNAAREGARYAAVYHCDTNGIKNQATTKAGNLGAGFVVQDPVGHYVGENLEYIVVTVQYTFEAVTPLIGNFLGEDGSITLESQARQMVEMKAACE